MKAYAVLVLVACSGAHQGGDDDPPDLPPTCPCPLESYCDLGTNTCHLGCLGDSGCKMGHICDAAARACVDGCRGDGDCGDHHICESNQCVVGCRTCPDSSDPCQMPVCQDGTCATTARVDGTACASDTNVCTSDVCVAGACTHPAVTGAPACADDHNECTTDVCASGGCAHHAVPDGNLCHPPVGNMNPTGDCAAGVCRLATRICQHPPSSGYWDVYQLQATGAYSYEGAYTSCYCMSPNTMLGFVTCNLGCVDTGTGSAERVLCYN